MNRGSRYVSSYRSHILPVYKGIRKCPFIYNTVLDLRPASFYQAAKQAVPYRLLNALRNYPMDEIK